MLLSTGRFYATSAGGGGFYAPVLTDSMSNAAPASSYTFTSRAIGTAHANRQLVLCIATMAPVGRAITSITVDGSSTGLVIELNDFSHSAFIARVPKSTGTTATFVVTFAGGIEAMALGIYDTRPITPTPVDKGSGGNSVTSFTIPDIAVSTGGFLIGCGLTYPQQTSAPVYNGVDTLTENAELSVGGTYPITVCFFSASTTENATTNDPGISSASSGAKRAAFISFL